VARKVIDLLLLLITMTECSPGGSRPARITGLNSRTENAHYRHRRGLSFVNEMNGSVMP
jgi:hypothetical protein